jgi:hypothetical protein
MECLGEQMREGGELRWGGHWFSVASVGVKTGTGYRVSRDVPRKSRGVGVKSLRMGRNYRHGRYIESILVFCLARPALQTAAMFLKCSNHMHGQSYKI